jgi:hypothetical protein
MSVNDVAVHYGRPVSMIATVAVDDYDVVIIGTGCNEVIKASGVTSRALGVVRNGAAAGSSVSVYGHTGDVYLCRVSATGATAGAVVGPAADGEVGDVTPGTTSALAVGIALKTGAVNDIIPVLWQPCVVVTHA